MGESYMEKLKQHILNEIKEKRLDAASGVKMFRSLADFASSIEPIAIVGISARLPQADGCDAFWENLKNKISSIRAYPKSRRIYTDHFLPDYLVDDDNAYQIQGYLEDINLFNPKFFGFSEAEAAKMSPLQRLVLYCSYEAIVDSGYSGRALSGTKTAVFVGNAQLGEPRYKDFIEILDGSGFIGNVNSVLPSRLSYRIGLEGNCTVVDSACSSGLLAVHTACEELQTGSISAAVVCGAAINLFPVKSDHVAMLESPQSTIHPFEDKADGTVWGEGVCSVMLKRLADATSDGDRIYAVIRGSGANNDGTSNGITAPNMQRQKELMEEVWDRFGINTEDIRYIEAHGTGTELGDPIEVKSITESFSSRTKLRQFCGLGSCKGNIGHLIGASGVAALIKSALSLYYGEVPPMHDFDTPNRYIDFTRTPLYICDEKLIIPPEDERFLVAINNFGISGTNVHVVLGKAPPLSQVELKMKTKKENLDEYFAGFDNYWPDQYGQTTPPRTLGTIIIETQETTQYKMTLTADKWCLNEHRILGKPTLPATAMIEMIYMAASQWLKTTMVAIENFYIATSVIVEDKRDIITKISNYSDKNVLVELLIDVSDEGESIYDCEWTVCASADVKTAEVLAITIPDISVFRGKGNRFLANRQVKGRVEYGPRWDCVKSYLLSDNTCSMEIELDKLYLSDLETHVIHPALLDLAINGLSFQLEGNYLPFTLEQFTIFRHFESRFSSLIQFNTEKSTDNTKYYNITLFDDLGVIAEICGYAVREVTSFGNNDKHECLSLTWKKVSDNDDKNPPQINKCLYISLGNNCLPTEVTESLPIVEHFLIPSDHVGMAGHTIRNASHVGLDSILISIDIKEDPAYCQSILLSVLDSVKEIIKIDGICSVLIVTKDDIIRTEKGQYVKPLSAALGCIARNICHEILGLKSRHIHLCGNLPAQHAVKEVLYGNDTEVAHIEAEGKFIPELCSNRLAFPSETTNDDNSVYVITGASGGLGKMLALYLCKPCATIIMVSRSGRRDKELEIHALKNKTNVEYFKSDVSDITRMTSLVDYITATFNHVNCIYHLAGIADNHFLSEMNLADAEKIITPKVTGSHNVLQLAHLVSAKRVVFFSSVSSLIGTPGQSAYSTANAYMDAIAQRFDSENLQVVSIQLPAVQEIGMAADNNATYSSAFHSIKPEELKKWMEITANCKSGVYCLAKINYSFALLDKMAWSLSNSLTARLNRKNRRKQRGRTWITDKKSVLTGRHDNQYTESEKKLAGIWGKVLECEVIDIDANFFESGGDSVMAISISNRIRDVFKKALDISSFFKNSTIRELAAFIDGTQGEIDSVIEIVSDMAHYPLSGEQRRIYALNTLNSQSLAYNLPITLELTGMVDIKKLEQSFMEVLNKNKSLRTKFFIHEDDIRQEICDGHQYKLEILDVRKTLSPIELTQIINRFIRPFDLNEGLLFRTLIVCENELHHYLIVDTHHIAADGYSMSLILRSFIAAYSNTVETSQTLRYVDYAVWSQARSDTGYLSARDYWVDTLSEEIPALELPYDYHRPTVKNDAGSTVQFAIDAKKAKRVRSVSTERGYTASLLLMTSFGLLLSKYSYLEELIIGIPYYGRENSQLESIVGMFVNTLPIRLNPKNGISYIQYLDESNTIYLEGMKNSCCNISNLIKELALERDLSRNPLFDVMFTFQNTDNKIEITDTITPEIKFQLSDISIQSVPYKKGISKLDLTLEIIERDQGYICIFEYNTDLFKPQTIDRFAESYLYILDQVIANPDINVEDISTISTHEQVQIQNEFNDTISLYSDDKTIIDLFEMQVEKSPDSIAVVSEETSITFCELKTKASVIANRLRESGVKPNDFVAIIAERSIEMIVGIFGILKSGAAYIPIAPDYPEQRIRYILENSAAKAIITQKPLAIEVKDIKAFSINDMAMQEDLIDLVSVNVPDDLAYMIYTSGTTGNPKGVMCHHRGLINRIEWMQNKYPIDSSDTILQKTTYTFDVSVWEIIWWSFTGAKVVMLEPGGEKEPAAICAAIARSQITTIHFVPSMLKAFLMHLSENPADIPRIRSLRNVFSSGEALKPEYVRDFYKQLKTYGNNTKIANFYGPTEASIDVTYYDCQEDQEIIPIGKPISNTSIFIRNGNCLCGIKVPGELCIAGVGVAKGYHGSEAMTNEKFIRNPYGEGKLYRTGDLARWLPDGNIEYLGRLDEQVKIRGFRIELEGIAKVIRKQPGIIDTVVIAQSDGSDDKYLCAYLVASKEVDEAQLTTQLKEDLPVYMIPSAYMQLEALPVTLNGKLNRSALPTIKRTALKEYIAPSNELECVLTDNIGQLLGINSVGIKDDFFRLGGDSIKAIQLSTRLRHSGYFLDIKSLYECSTIEELAHHVKKKLIVADQNPVTGTAFLLPIQRAFLELKSACPNHFNQEVLCVYDGTINSGAMESAIKRLIAHHDALRLCFPAATPLSQFNRAETEDNLFVLKEYTIKNEAEQELVNVINAGHTLIDIENGPAFVSIIFHADTNDYLFMAAHHLVCDGISWRIILEDIEGLYIDECGMAKYSLPVKTSSYLDWCQVVEQRKKSARVLEQQHYWEKVCLESPLRDRQYLKKDVHRKAIEIDQKTARIICENYFKLRTLTFKEILLLAYYESIQDLESHFPSCVMLESHGREDISTQVDISRTVGWFTTEYPFSIPYCERNDCLSNLALIKEAQKQIPNNGFDFSLLQNRPNRGRSLQPSDVIINYMGDFIDTHSQSKFKLCTSISGSLSSLENTAKYNIEINAFGLNDTIRIIIDYTPHYTENHIEVITEKMKKSILNIAANLEKSTEMVTPFDYGSNHITLTDLNQITTSFDQMSIDKIYSLSPMQQNILTIAMISSTTDVYYERFSFMLDGEVDADTMRKSFEMVINAHDVFKTVFYNKAISEPVQIVLTNAEADFRFTEVGGDNTTAQIRKTIEEDQLEGFDISKGKLLRMRLLHIGENKNYIIFSFHHIILDGWCISLILNEIFETYFSLCSNVIPKIQEVFSYADYIRSCNNSGKLESTLFWQNHLSGLNGAIELPSRLKSTAAEYVQRNTEITIASEVIDKAMKLSKNYRATISMLFQGIWAVLLSYLSGRDHVVFGYVVSGRNPELPGVNHMLGLFINTIPMHVYLNHNDTFVDLLEQVRKHNIEAEKHCFLAIGDIAESAGLDVQIIDNAMVFENYPVVGQLDFSKKEQEYKGMYISEPEYFEQSTLPMSVKVIPGQNYTLVFRYNQELYTDAVVQVMADTFVALLEQIVSDSDITIGHLIEIEGTLEDGFNDILE